MEGPLSQSSSPLSVLQNRPAHLPQQSNLQLGDHEQLLAPSARQEQHHNHFRAAGFLKMSREDVPKSLETNFPQIQNLHQLPALVFGMDG